MFGRIRLPQNDFEFGALVDRLMEETGCEDRELVEAVLANRIQHMPPAEAHTTMRSLRDYIWKSVAYEFARQKTSYISQVRIAKIAQQRLMENPNDQEAIDSLQLMSEKGVEIAKQAMAQIHELKKNGPFLVKGEDTADQAVSDAPTPA